METWIDKEKSPGEYEVDRGQVIATTAAKGYPALKEERDIGSKRSGNVMEHVERKAFGSEEPLCRAERGSGVRTPPAKPSANRKMLIDREVESL